MRKRRIKPLLPSLREKKRYLVFEVLSKQHLQSFASIQRQLWHSMLQVYGETGTAAAGFWVLPDKYDAQRQVGILKANHHAVPQVKAALTLIQSIDQEPVIVRTCGVSGILNKAIKYMPSAEQESSMVGNKKR